MDLKLKLESEKIKKWILKNKIIILLFVFSTLFFLFQNYTYLGWDFSAYLINAKYFFHGGHYFEVYRAPLISMILGIFLFLGNIARHLYIITISSLFFISVIKLSDALYEKYFNKYDIKKETFAFFLYFFSLSLFSLCYGLTEGTELLGLALFQLFLAYFIKNKYCGHFLGFAFLSRYNFLIFFPFLFVNKNYKKILKNIFLALLVTIPWFLFNYIQWGNLFTSVIDSYYLNMLSRTDSIQPFNFLSLFKPIGWFLPFFLAGFIPLFKKIKRKSFSEYKFELLFLIILLISIYEVYSIPFKVSRYMFNMVLPTAFFSTLGTLVIIKKYPKIKKPLIAIFLISFFISIIYLGSYFYIGMDRYGMFYESSQKIKELGIENCKIFSPHWVPVNYYSGNVYYLSLNLSSIVKNNKIALIFQNHKTMDDTFRMNEIDNYPHIFKSEKFLFIANKSITNQTCVQKHNFDSPMVKQPCKILSKRFEKLKLDNFTEKICLLLNKQ